MSVEYVTGPSEGLAVCGFVWDFALPCNAHVFYFFSPLVSQGCCQGRQADFGSEWLQLTLPRPEVRAES